MKIWIFFQPACNAILQILKVFIPFEITENASTVVFP